MLRVLIVEDSDDDAQLLLHALRQGDYYEVVSRRVDTPGAMRAALADEKWDAIISDYSMPQFSGLAALALLKELKPDMPFIIVSGTIGEETAVEAMRSGANDYLMKGRLQRLIPVMERELREAANREERRHAEQSLLLTDRMASVGTLAAGVAHEINNPLSYVMANLDFATKYISERAKLSQGQFDDTLEVLREAREGAERIRLIVRDLKTFSRADTDRRGAVDIRRILDSSVNMVWNEIRHRARLVKDYAEIPPVEGNEPRLGQVFLNLLVNAAHAIPEGHAERNEIRLSTRLRDSSSVVVEVRDSGSGIPTDVIGRIFEPFFTTKPIGVGTGLGLSISHSIVTSLGGQLSVESDVGKGTVFRIVLPVAKAEVLETKPVAPVEGGGRRGRILVVDDEPMVASALRRILAPEHEVVVLTNAREALNRVISGESFDLILCDLMMPELTGMELHAQLASRVPEQARRMVFLTGGAFTAGARAFLEEVPNHRVEKPFDGQSLRVLLRDLLR